MRDTRWMRWVVGCVLFIMCSLLAGCGSKRPVSKPVANPAIFIDPAAKNVRVGPVRQGDQQAIYTVAEPYPAAGLLNRIKVSMAKKGWKARKTDFLNPGLPSSHVTGWNLFLDSSRQPAKTVHQWMGDWERNGEIVTYGLRYTSDSKQLQPQGDVTVVVNYMDASAAASAAAITSKPPKNGAAPK